MKPVVALLGLVLLLHNTFAAEESCAGRCGAFDALKKCQCDSMCVYYGSCCSDFQTACPKRTRGDTFVESEVTEAAPAADDDFTTAEPPRLTPVLPTIPTAPATNATRRPAATVEPDAAPCSGRPFDAFLQLKNGSMYAFRGEYFFELDEKSVLPGYPRLIQDVWGIPGPISAAFTRINCQGKSYLFKGKQYWRFDGDVLDKDYPRDIAVGFDGVPDDIDAAFAIPAPSHRGREKAYFFKGENYYQYEFKQQPSHEECVEMSRSSPSVLFTRYTHVYCDHGLEDFFTQLFGEPLSSFQTGPRLTRRDWIGVPAPVDAAIVGPVYVSPQPTPSLPPAVRRRGGSRRSRINKRRKSRRRQSRGLFDYLMLDDDFFDLFDDYAYDETAMQDISTPVQKVYFFKKDKYYRASLQTKRVEAVSPPYPRSIAKYWLGCEHEDVADPSRAEKR
ncbi:vitronectin b [Salarias fasciatus]|uniref:Vitronectin-like n=1 Tax=Salarias fasciatus TaxID=181472 RepID=A0A672HK76_SALFA|nr:vitronectin-like [Salarias fasciatus]